MLQHDRGRADGGREGLDPGTPPPGHPLPHPPQGRRQTNARARGKAPLYAERWNRMVNLEDILSWSIIPLIGTILFIMVFWFRKKRYVRRRAQGV